MSLTSAQEQFYSDVMDNNTIEEISDFLSSPADPWVLKECGITEAEYFEVMEACYAQYR